MKTRLLSMSLMLCVVQGMMAQYISLGLVDESNIHQAEQKYGINKPFIFFVPQMSFVGEKLYAGTPSGLYTRELSEGAEWEKMPGIDTSVVDFAVRGDTLAVLTHDTLYLSSDCGATFTTTPFVVDDDHPQKRFFHVTFHPSDAKRVYVSYCGTSYSSDFGKTWEKVSSLFLVDGTYAGPTGLSFNPHDYSNIVTYGNGMMGGFTQLISSFDGGVTWSRGLELSGSVEGYNVAFHPVNKNKVIAWGMGVYAMSEDQGKTWKQICKSYDEIDGYNDPVIVHLFDLVYDTRNPDVLYGADLKSLSKENIVLLRSVDGGMTWEEFYTIDSESYDAALKLAMKDNLLAIYSRKSGIYLLDVDAVDTSVSPIVNDEDEPAYYDIQGRKVAHPTRGIYIKDGRKVVF